MGLNWDIIKTCVIDMDGTILDLHFDHQVWHFELPHRLAKKNKQKFSEAKGKISDITKSKRGTLEWYDLGYWKTELNIDLDEIEIALSSLIKIRAGAIDFLKTLKKKDVTMILATNAHPRGLERKLQKTDIGKFFNHIVSSHNFGVAKENLEFWQILNEKYPFENSSTFLLDDNLVVLETAHKFGLKHIYGIERPNSQGDSYSSEFFELLADYSTLL